MDDSQDIPSACACTCGCGEMAKAGRRFIHGHNRRLSGQEFAVDVATGCWLWQRSFASDGYPAPAKLPGQESKRAWRAIYERERGPIPEGMHLHHRCGNKCCVNPDHLESLLPAEHYKLHGKTNVTPAMLSEARRLLASGLSQRKVAARIGVSRGGLRHRLGLN